MRRRIRVFERNLYAGSTRPISVKAREWVLIIRDRKIEGEANRHDPGTGKLSEKRLDADMMATDKGKELLDRLWKEQNGECPLPPPKDHQEYGMA